MKIWTLWRYNTGDNDGMPWLVSSYDEYAAEEHGVEPRFSANEREPGDRQLIVTIPEDAVLALFGTSTVGGKVHP